MDKELIAKLAQEAGFEVTLEGKRFVRLGADDEVPLEAYTRAVAEHCAKLCDGLGQHKAFTLIADAHDCAAAIREAFKV